MLAFVFSTIQEIEESGFRIQYDFEFLFLHNFFSSFLQFSCQFAVHLIFSCLSFLREHYNLKISFYFFRYCVNAFFLYSV